MNENVNTFEHFLEELLIKTNNEKYKIITNNYVITSINQNFSY